MNKDDKQKVMAEIAKVLAELTPGHYVTSEKLSVCSPVVTDILYRHRYSQGGKRTLQYIKRIVKEIKKSTLYDCQRIFAMRFVVKLPRKEQTKKRTTKKVWAWSTPSQTEAQDIANFADKLAATFIKIGDQTFQILNVEPVTDQTDKAIEKRKKKSKELIVEVIEPKQQQQQA